MLRLQGGQVESLWDELLPERLRELPEDLARIDALLRDEALLVPIEAHWEQEARRRGRSAKGHGRPTIPMQTLVRLMLLKHRYGWGYETLMREVSDSLHLRRFCLIPLEQEVPDESMVRKLTRRLGPAVVAELSRLVIAKAQRERRFRARAVRIDSTVVEADMRYPTDAGLAATGCESLPARASGWPPSSAGRGRRSGPLAGGRQAAAGDRAGGRYRTVEEGLEVKQVWVGEGETRRRFVVCRNLDEAKRDQLRREKWLKRIGAELEQVEGKQGKAQAGRGPS